MVHAKYKRVLLLFALLEGEKERGERERETKIAENSVLLKDEG